MLFVLYEQYTNSADVQSKGRLCVGSAKYRGHKTFETKRKDDKNDSSLPPTSCGPAIKSFRQNYYFKVDLGSP